MIRILATDIDNTLYSHKTHQIPPVNRQAVRRLQEAGVLVVLATARIYAGARSIAEELNFPEYGGLVIASAGAELIDCASGQRRPLNTIPIEEIRKLKEFAEAHQINLSVQQEDLLIATGYDEGLDSDRRIVGIDVLVVGSDFYSFLTKPVCMAGLTGTEAQLDAVEELARRELQGVSLVRSGPHFLDITPRGVSKAYALEVILKEHGWTRQEAAAIGDSNNDIEILQAAGLSAAPADGAEKVKALCDIITVPCPEGAVADLINRVILPLNAREAQ